MKVRVMVSLDPDPAGEGYGSMTVNQAHDLGPWTWEQLGAVLAKLDRIGEWLTPDGAPPPTPARAGDVGLRVRSADHLRFESSLLDLAHRVLRRAPGTVWEWAPLSAGLELRDSNGVPLYLEVGRLGGR